MGRGLPCRCRSRHGERPTHADVGAGAWGEAYHADVGAGGERPTHADVGEGG
jgi:hypothetical protein